MRIVLFVHSLVSDWNHGNAHFLRGVASELVARGHDVTVYEPENAWSYRHLAQELGFEETLARFHTVYPSLKSSRYGADFELTAVLDEADLVIVHEWNSEEL